MHVSRKHLKKRDQESYMQDRMHIYQILIISIYETLFFYIAIISPVCSFGVHLLLYRVSNVMLLNFQSLLTFRAPRNTFVNQTVILSVINRYLKNRWSY